MNGRFRLALGTHTPLSPAVFVASNGLWLGMKVETDPELDRRPLGSAPYALHAATAHSAASAASLDCTGCIPPEALSNEAVLDILDTTLLAVQNAGYVHEGDLSAGSVPYDGAGSELGAASVQGAIDELKALIDDGGAGGGPVNEGAGQVVAFQMSESVPSYGTATQYVHLVNPSTPKVVTHAYGKEATGAGGAGNLVVAYDFKPNQYSAGASGVQGDDSIQVENPSLFNTGNHVLLHQTTGGNGATAGTWEINQVLSVNGNNLQLVKTLENDYVNDGTARAQLVLAASFGHLEVVSGGKVSPAAALGADGASGGVVYIRANQVSVGSGGTIEADGAGFVGGPEGAPLNQGSSDCGAGASANTSANCAGGGAGQKYCASSGGGGNQTDGGDGEISPHCDGPGSGGSANSGVGTSLLHMGGGGGGSLRGAGGAGGGLVVIGAQTVVVAQGGRISADGTSASTPGAGGGAGGTVALFVDILESEGDVQALGGAGGTGSGWEFIENPTETGNLFFDTHSHGGGYYPLTGEFWYPEWNGSTIYRHAPNGDQLGSFSSGQGNMMQLWGDPDGSYYTANWGNDRIYKWKSAAQPGVEVWNRHMDSTAGGVCSDGEVVYGVRECCTDEIKRFDQETGEQLSSIYRNGGGYNSIYSMICLPGRLILLHSCTAAYVYDSSNGNYQGEVNISECPNNTSFDGQTMWISNNDSSVRGYALTTGSIYEAYADGGAGGEGWMMEGAPVPGIVNESYPKGVRIFIDGNDVTSSVGDPNGKGAPSYDPEVGWGASGLHSWSTGPLDVTNVANWTLGEHVVELRETGGAGGQLKAYTYVIYPFTESTPPVNDTCSSPVALDPNSGPVVVSGTTEDIMGKTLATDANQQAGCGGQGGSDVVYRIDLDQRSLLNVVVQAPFPTRLYLRETSCVSGSQVYCSDGDFTTNPIEAGTYFLFVDS
ncbi:MAG: hypothetical protein VX938_13815, partial [Myxococcota bacterium]|nr:hypothetical protein [Myxococcota bacterium]